MEWFDPENFFDLKGLGPLAGLFEGVGRVWEILDSLTPYIARTMRPNVAELRRRGGLTAEPAGLLEGRVYWGVDYEPGDPAKGGLRVYHQGHELPGAALIMPGVMLADDGLEIGDGALVESGAFLRGPSVIGPRSEVRQGAYVRGGVWSAPGALIGHATEAKNALLLPGAKAGHFAYLGDSLLGREVHLGAGTKLANLKMTRFPYVFRVGGREEEVKRRKFGAIIGDGASTGCNAVTNPGVLLGREAKVLPNISVPSGYYPAQSLIRGR
ncbi:MAG: glucose-1-phosphate thymidylyltransferase [Candidatus Adiutrix sp.]|jgi:acetyltransferase-like isoleucine patch superfamily enzyme|nr:glucose-1-phosphate thymidylyltransferase [Candidatus Adiutrix sp.]